MRRQILAGGLLLAIGVAAAPICSQAAAIIVGVAPPAAQVEVIPAARVGYVWTPGYWHWNGYRHVWAGGYWLRERPGWHWVAPRWSAYGPRWHYSAGYWAR
jgi:WXXGXW repeat (2 copies)